MPDKHPKPLRYRVFVEGNPPESYARKDDARQAIRRWTERGVPASLWDTRSHPLSLNSSLRGQKG